MTGDLGVSEGVQAEDSSAEDVQVIDKATIGDDDTRFAALTAELAALRADVEQLKSRSEERANQDEQQVSRMVFMVKSSIVCATVVLCAAGSFLITSDRGESQTQRPPGNGPTLETITREKIATLVKSEQDGSEQDGSEQDENSPREARRRVSGGKNTSWLRTSSSEADDDIGKQPDGVRR